MYQYSLVSSREPAAYSSAHYVTTLGLTGRRVLPVRCEGSRAGNTDGTALAWRNAAGRSCLTLMVSAPVSGFVLKAAGNWFYFSFRYGFLML